MEVGVVPWLITSPAVKDTLRGSYVASGAASGYEISQIVGLTVGTIIAIVTLTLAIRSGNRKTRREVAGDIDDAYQKGKNDQKEEMQPWLDYWKEAAQGSLRPPLPPPPPIREGDGHDQ